LIYDRCCALLQHTHALIQVNGLPRGNDPARGLCYRFRILSATH
jgi:hypothetical protein